MYDFANSIEGLAGSDSLRRLERLRELECLDCKNLQIFQDSYLNIDLPAPDECVIYCDPPYINTAGYISGDFNHAGFYDFVENLAKKDYKVFISEYEMPLDRFKSVYNVAKRQKLNGKGTGKIKQEHLFTPICEQNIKAKIA